MIERYTRPEMGRIWTLENKFARWMQIEILACEAWAELGVVPREDAARIRERSGFDVDRILELEKQTRHDVVAFTACMAEYVGQPEAKWIHYGLTSSDVVDTALSSLMVEATDLLLENLCELLDVLGEQARRYKDQVVVGRTHGVHAEPTTLGLKFALWYAETERNLERLRRARQTVATGKLSGAVGTYAHLDPLVEQFVCEKLGLEPASISTQIVQRDRHAELLCTLALVGSSLEKFATEIRSLQRTELREVEEPFRAGQKGSSAMPHKRNPIVSERISGLARVLRANAQAAMENIALWHERDISHSSVERIIIPDSTILLNYMLHKFIDVVQGLHVYPENMERVLETTRGLVFSQRVLLALVDSGLSREEAYGIVQAQAMAAWQHRADFRDLIRADERVREAMGEDKLEECFSYEPHLRHVDKIFERLGLL